MRNNDTIKKTLIVAISLCLVCSALISFSAVELRGLQEANKTLDKQSKILSAAGLLEDEQEISSLFNSIEVNHIRRTIFYSYNARNISGRTYSFWFER